MANREPIVLPELGDRIILRDVVWVVVARYCDSDDRVDCHRLPETSAVELRLARVGPLPKQEARCNSRSG